MSNPTGTSTAGFKRPLHHLESILIDGETLQGWAVQHRLYALNHRRLLLGATSGRLIAMTRPILGGYDISDIRWQDLMDVKLHVGVLAATLTLTAAARSDLTLQEKKHEVVQYTGLRKDQAEHVYRISQMQFQAWREKRRVRDLDELRARSGGIAAGPGFGAVAAAAGAEAQAAVAAHLRQAEELLKARIISDAEYEALKAKIIAS
jgi:hypothetical protein